MSALQPFNPAYGSTRSMVGAAGEQTLAYAQPLSGGWPPQVLLTNAGTVTVFVRVADTADTTAASAADLPILANTQVVVTVNRFAAFTIRLAAGATGSTVYATLGSGF